MIKKKVNTIVKYINKYILWIFSFLWGITFIFAACGKNYINNSTSPDITLMSSKISNFEFSKLTSSTLMMIIFFVTLAVLYKFVDPFKKAIKSIFIKNKKITSMIMLTIACIIQLVFVLNVHPFINYDVGNIISTAQGNNSTPASYYSQYPDVLFLLIIERTIANIAGKSQLTFVLANLIMLYLSVILNTVCVRIINKDKVPTLMYIQSCWLLLFPMSLAPYTDVYILPFISLALVAYAMLTKIKKFKVRIIASALLAFSIAEGYFLKPTAIILLIAVVIILSCKLLKKIWNLRIKRQFLACLMVFGGIFCITFGVNSKIVSEQQIIPIDNKVATPPIRLMAMGLVGNGGYNREDAEGNIGVPTNEQIKTSKEKIVRRLKDKGLLGYLVFLVEKQADDTTDGTFGWLNEGYFLNEDAPKTSLGQWMSSYIYPSGIHLFDFKFLAQLCWVVLIAMILFGFKNKGSFSQLLRLSITGLMIFLLMFEGGRTRYMIQFLPCFLILATLCWNNTKIFLIHDVPQKIVWFIEMIKSGIIKIKK